VFDTGGATQNDPFHQRRPTSKARSPLGPLEGGESDSISNQRPDDEGSLANRAGPGGAATGGYKSAQALDDLVSGAEFQGTRPRAVSNPLS